MAKGRAKIITKKALSTVEQEKALKQLHAKDVKEKKEKVVQRVTVDFPVDIYAEMKKEVKNNGQTIKGLIVNLVKHHLAEKA